MRSAAKNGSAIRGAHDPKKSVTIEHIARCNLTMVKLGWLDASQEMGESPPGMRCRTQRIVNVNVAEIGARSAGLHWREMSEKKVQTRRTPALQHKWACYETRHRLDSADATLRVYPFVYPVGGV